MAPKKPTVTKRLVSVVTNLEEVVLDMQQKLDCCYIVIKEQQELIRTINIKTDKHTQMLKTITSPTRSTNVLSVKKTKVQNNLPEQGNPNHKNVQHSTTQLETTLTSIPSMLRLSSLNDFDDSGPEGLTMVEVNKNQQKLQSSPQSKTQQAVGVATGTNPRSSPSSNRRWERQTNCITSTPEAVGTRQTSRSATHQKPPTVLAPGNPSTHRFTNEGRQGEAKGVGLCAGPPRVASFHLFNFSQSTVSQDITSHLKSRVGLENLTCVQLQTKGQYSSFRLDVPTNKAHLIRNDKLWPEGVSIRNYNVVTSKNLNPRRAPNSRT
ncbi:hypothetical protein O0L34_g5763 [Tuta absoluta]|nr:hypothetical protein O0L34_g5763 [Tuta absoluta]